MYDSIVYGTILYLLRIIHQIVWLYNEICLYCSKILFKSNNDIETLSSDLKNIEKRLSHLALVLGNEEPSYEDIGNIVKWAALTHIPFISLYDHNGVLKQTKNKLYETLDKNNIKYETGSLRKHKNGKSQSSIHVNIISMGDGQKSVTEITKLCAINKVKDIEKDYIDQELRKRIGEFPDPELALYCGSLCSTYGILPWQIRLTEFVDIRTHHGITVSKFKAALDRYELSEQRYGK